MMRRYATTLTVLVILLALTGPAFAQTLLFGPTQYTRTAGPPNQFTDTFTLPAGTTAPYTLHVVNGNANGTNRVSSATVTLNGTQILGPSDFGQNVAVIDRTVTLQANNTLEIRLTSAPGSFSTLSVLDTSAGSQPTALTPNPLNLGAGATGTLTATLAPAPTASGTLAVSSANTAVATAPASIPFAAGQTSVPFTVTAVASGSTTVTATLNGGSAACQVTVTPPPPTITSFTPASGTVGTTVTIIGTNFINVQTVTFNGVAAIFTINNATTMTAVVPTGATTGKIAVTDAAGTAQSATDFTVLNPVPILSTLSPSTLPAGSPATTLTITGQEFVAGAVVKFGATVVTTTFVSTTQLTATIPATLLTTKSTAQVTVENPAPGGGLSNSLPFTITNGPPRLAPIGNQTVPLGSTLTFTVTATDPDNDPVSFAATPLPLPAHAAFNAQTGVFLFTPDATQVGAFPLTISAFDGIVTSSETITVTVTGAPAGGITGVSGRVVDGSGQPIANLPVSLKGTVATTTTTAQGQFTLNTLAVSGRHVLLADGFAQGYAILAAPVDLIPNVLNQLPSDLRVPALDMASAITVNPNATTVLGNPTFPGVSVTIPPHTAKNPDGTDYTGVLTISPVPEYGRPESRPVELKPGFSITIQPAGIVLDPPVPITLPNTDNMPPGNEFDLWSLYPDTGTFLVVGRMRVSADGSTLEMIPGTGGVRKTAWHFAQPPNPTSTPPQNPNLDDCPECQGVGSGGRLSDGALTHEATIPGVRTLGISRDLALHYRSTSADVQPILPVNAFLSVRAAVPQTFSASLTLGGSEMVSGLHWNSIGLPENNDSISRLGVQFNGAALQTGRYGVDLTLYSNYPQSSIGGISRQQMLVRNEQQSPYGAGWTLTSVDRLLIQPNGELVLAQGTGGTETFAPAAAPLVIASPSLTRSRVVNGDNASFVAGNIHAQPRADLQNVANFSPTGTVKRNVTFRSGLDVITLDALAGVDIFIINMLATELTLSEVQALEQFVAEGGAVLEMENLSPTRLPFLGTLPGPFVSDTSADLSLDGLNSVLANGPFGTVTSPVGTGANSVYATGGFATSMARNDQGQNMLLLPPGNLFSKQGRAVLVGDEEIFAGAYPNGGGGTFYTLPNNVRFFLNSIAYLAGTPGYKPGAPTVVTTSFQGPPGDFSTIVKNADGTYTRTMKDGTVSQFSAQGYQTATRDRNGNTTTYGYNGNNRLITINDPVGQVTTLAYSGNWLQSVTDAAGHMTTLTHDGAGNLTAIDSVDGARETFNYDANHRLVDRRDARGARTQYQYDYAKRFSTSIKPTGETASIVPSQRLAVPDIASGQGTAANPAALSTSIVNAASYTDGRNHTTTFELDSLRRVTKQTDALNRTTTITRDPQGNPLTITRPNGAVTTMTYDAKGNLLASTEPNIAATTAFVYEPTFNQVTRITDPKGNQTNIVYDAKGNPLTITDADNKVTTFTYNAQGLLLTTKDALNQTTTFTYDALGRLLTTTDPLNRTTTLTYDGAGNVATSSDALNRVTRFEYDAKNRLTQVTDPAGGITRYTYDGNGNLLTVKDAKNQTTTFAYDERNRLLSTTDPLGKTESYTYDGNDNLTKRRTPRGDDILFAYDAVNQLLSKTLPGNQVTSYQYGLAGNLRNVTDPDSVLAMTYDPANRLTTVKTDGSPNQPAVTLAYSYDRNGNRLSSLDPVLLSHYTYDSLNRLTTLTSPPGQPSSTTGLLAAWLAEGTAEDAVGGQHGTLQNGVAFAPGQLGQAFLFDGVDDYVTVPDSTVLDSVTTAIGMESWIKPETTPHFTASIFARRDPAVSEGFTVDLLVTGGLQVSVRTSTSPTISGSFFRSAPGAIVLGQFQHLAVTASTVTGLVQAYVNGQEIPLTVVSGPATLSGALVNVTQLFIGQRQSDAVAGPENGAHFKGLIDEVRLYARILTPGEILASANQSGATFAYDVLSRRTSLTLPNGTQTTYTYDPASQVTAISHQLTALSSQINKAEYGYNAVGNRTSLTDRRGAQAFGYDTLDRLTSATHPLLLTPQAFAYDAVGNRTTGGTVVNAGNQLTADTNFSYQYDDNGNLTRKTLLATGNSTAYTYDAENRLTKVEEFTAGNPTPFATSTYRYDGLGRRIEKVANGQTTRYIYDGEDILLEYDGSNVLQARYTHGPGIDEPIAMTRGGSTYFYHQDGLGTVTDLTDSTGTTAKSYSYDAYGNLVDQTGTVEQPYTYTGREFDAETGFYYLRGRYYDPRLGRFLGKDPIGPKAGSNRYIYVLGNPINYFDPYGYTPVGDFFAGAGSYFEGLYGAARFISRYSGFLGACERERAKLEDQALEAVIDLLRNDADARKQAGELAQDYISNHKARVAGRLLTAQGINYGLRSAGGVLGAGVGLGLTATAIIGNIRLEFEHGGRSVEDFVNSATGGEVSSAGSAPLVCGCQ